MPIISAQGRGPKRRRLTSSLGASLSLAHFHGFPFSLSSLKNRTKPITVHGSFCQKLPSVCFLKNGAVADFKRAIIVSGYGEIEFLGNPYDLGCWFGEERFYGAISLGGPKPKAWIAHQWNKFIRWHCERAPLGFGSVSQEGLGWDDRWNSAHSEDGNLELAAQEQKKVLILMSDTGGGHRASAEAIKATFELEYGDQFNVTIVDLWKEHTPWPFNQVPNTYSFLVKHETLWKFTFHGTRPRLVHQTNFAATSIFIAREVAKGLLKYKPDVIVSVHPLMQHIPLRILKSKGLLDKIPFTTVITDLSTCHPTWFHKLTTICFCPTKEVANKAYKAGLKPSQIRVHGLPVRPSFCKPARPKNELRKELEMDEELPAVLLMGGGEGMGPVEATARALGEALVDEPGGRAFGQLVIICGRNKRLVEKLKSHEWSIPVQIRGFVTNISDWMGACDCIITKAGPGTIAEAMIRGLPLLINDYIAGQEVGNVPYVVDNGAGKYCQDPKEIASTISQWFSTKSDEFKQMALNASRLARPNAVFNIVHDLAELAQQRTDLKKFRIPIT